MLVLDIETVKTDDEALIAYKVAGKKREDYKQAALDKLSINAHTGKIILAGMISDKPIPDWTNDAVEQGYAETLIGLDGNSETYIVTYLWNCIYSELESGGRIVTYNGKKFDIPYLIKRAMILGVHHHTKN